MSRLFEVRVEGLQNLDRILLDSKKIDLAASRAVNATARLGRKKGAERIKRQVNFPDDYLSENGKRLTVARFANPGDLEARVRARQRPTSLARFATSALKPGASGGVTVTIKPGTSRTLRRAFPIALRAGAAGIDTKANMGLAIRLRKGETFRGKTKMIKMAAGRKSALFLLYGPSVDQVWSTVRGDLVPELEDALADEFLRLMDVNL